MSLLLSVTLAATVTGLEHDLAARTGDLALAQSVTQQITRAALPGFYFHDRGG